MYYSESRCHICEHFCRNNNDGLGCGCRAFPDGIPEEARAGYSHDSIIQGQVGDYVFTPRDENNLTDFAKWLKEQAKKLH